MKAETPVSVDAYIRSFSPVIQNVLQQLRSTILSVATGAEEVISYKMPAYKYHGMLVYFAAFKDHCSFFPAGKSVLVAFEKELKPYKTFGGTIQFSTDHPLPAELVRRIVQFRMKENEVKKAAKRSK